MTASWASRGSQPWRWQASENTRSMLSDSARVDGRVALVEQPRQVVLQDRPGDAGLVGDAGVALGEERREPGHGQRPGADGRERAPGGQAEPGPPLDRVAQPVLGDGVEPRRAAARGGRERPAAPAFQWSPAYSASSPAAWPWTSTGRGLAAAARRRPALTARSRSRPTPRPGSGPPARRRRRGGCRSGWWSSRTGA